MKKIFTSIGLLFLIQSFNLSAQVTCLKFESPVEIEGAELPEDVQLLIGQSIEISNLSVYFQDALFASQIVKNQAFSGKGYLVDRYSGLYEFSDCTDSIYGYHSIHRFYNSLPNSNNNQIEIIKIKDQGIQKYFILYDGLLFKMTECQNYEPCYGEGLRSIGYEGDSILYVTKQPRYKSEINPAQFEAHHQFYIKEWLSGRHYIDSARFETVEEELLSNQVNVCPEFTVVYDTIQEQVLVQDAYTVLEIIPAIYDTVSELILLKEGYNKLVDFKPHDYESYDSCMISSDKRGEFLNKKILSLEHLKLCPSGYETRLSGCYKIDSVGAEYKSRLYRKMVKPESVESKTINAIYALRTYTKIKNKDQVPRRCIKTEFVTREYRKLAADGHAAYSPYCPNYSKRYFDKRVSDFNIIEEIEVEGESIHLDATNKIYCGSDDLVSVELVCEKFITKALIEKIIAKLRLTGYDIPLENNKQEYLEALTAFQKKNNLVIGLLSIETLEFMDVSF